MAQPIGSRELEQQLCAELLEVHRASYGKPAASAHVLFDDDAIVVFLDGLELQPSERFLIDSGHGRDVVATRSHFEEAIEVTFCAAVERVTGRRVVSFASLTKLDPTYGIEVFRLAPSGP